jgi:carboxyl-terminal processing protease
MLKRIQKTVILSALMAGSFAAGLSLQPVLAETPTFTSFIQIFDKIKLEYVEKNVDEQKLVDGAIKGMLAVLNDPYTRYINKSEYKQMAEEREGSFSGIGIQIGTREEKLTVISPIEDTPAWKAGLLAGDIIQAIEGKSTKEMDVNDAVDLIRGRDGTPVMLTIYRPETKEVKDVKIVRGKIENQIVKSKMINDKVGYLRLTTFMQDDAPEKMREALKDLKKKGMTALVLDIRSNPGGLLPNAVDIGSLFIERKQGPIVRIVDREGHEEVLNPNGRTEINQQIPMVVLIDGGSASASEILAGALKDTSRATLVGTRSFGKGLVQTVHTLEDGGALAITTNKYLTTKGTDINKKGIEPDVEVKIPKELLSSPYDEQKDVQLKKAVEILNTRLVKK